ncbi:hypothetical protein F2P81_006029 [Scophthalmus maximus]|uniref:Uncharacterized protein n=1 Tax=Scophthalmus maximus TaxID=52904 RepID=A0A6A4T849_SCOMX|nr:hypothetical protein F2P81_006029 [Scophthalmus maximus]
MQLLVRSNYWASRFKLTPPSVTSFGQTRKEDDAADTLVEVFSVQFRTNSGAVGGGNVIPTKLPDMLRKFELKENSCCQQLSNALRDRKRDAFAVLADLAQQDTGRSPWIWPHQLQLSSLETSSVDATDDDMRCLDVDFVAKFCKYKMNRRSHSQPKGNAP